MSAESRPRPVLSSSLRALRFRLTAWYAGTFLVILTLLGIGMFAAITRRFDADLDTSLREGAGELARVARERGAEAAPSLLRIPDRHLLMYDGGGRRLSSDTTIAEPWIDSLAARAAREGHAAQSHSVGRERILRAYARAGTSGASSTVAIAVADEIELEDRYTALIAAFGAAALIAVLLVAVGGWIVARQSAAPVERAIEYMRRFMADAAHELRTPITVVRSRAEIALQRSRDPSEYAAALQAIAHESERLGRIVDDLLTLARADSGERPLERVRVFLDDTALDAASAARAIADRKGVHLEVGTFDEAPVAGDPALLRQMVMILLDNAVKFTPAGGNVRVNVQASGDGSTVTVVDTGCGIPFDQLPRVFDRFFRGDPARTRGSGDAAQGAGLGLAIARWIAEAHGAGIQVRSEAGQGTTVSVHFPPAAPSSLSYS